MSSIVILQVAAGCLYMVTITVVGIKLLVMAAKKRVWPEFFLGMSLLVGGTLGASAEAAGMSMLVAEGPEVGGPLIMIGKVFGLVAILGQGLFIWKVFRPDESWAPWLVAGLVMLPFLTLFGFLHHGTHYNAELPPMLFAIEFVGRIGGSCWLILEALRYYGLMKRRLALGLADAVVTNRFLLWSIAGISSLLMLCTSVPPVFMDPSYATLMAVDLVLFALSGIATCILFTLTFFPPESYRTWILKRAAEAR